MSAQLFLQVALPTPLKQLFDYLPPEVVDFTSLKPGVRVKVPFKQKQLTGILVHLSNISTLSYERIKPAISVIDEVPLISEDVLKLSKWMADYYHRSLGEILSQGLPLALRQGKLVDEICVPLDANDVYEPPILNDQQQNAVEKILSIPSHFQPFLLHGITGSGKTEVYLAVIEAYLAQGKQVLVLVPEISLTPQLIARFRKRLQAPIAIFHSSLLPKARLSTWLAAKGGHVKVIIGTRSALFTPFANLGLIIVDEEHDAAFKQQDRCRYHGRDVAVMRALINKIPIILGSATPSFESLLNCERNRYQYLSLPDRAGGAALPICETVDMRAQIKSNGLSTPLIHAMKQTIAAGNQALLFLNRRGFAPVLYCIQCGWIAICNRCEMRLVYHLNPLQLQCHHCDITKKIAQQCEQCHATPLQPVGLGTQRLEQTLQKLFPNISIIRMDRDNTRRKGTLETLLQQIRETPSAILLGTQMLSKGHDFPNVTLVGVIDVEGGLLSANFRAPEQMGQLLLQVAGRAGRAHKPGKVLIQTYNPSHPLLDLLLQKGYQAFADHLLAERKQSHLPPFYYLALLRTESHRKEQGWQLLQDIKSQLSNFQSVDILGPASAFISKKKGRFLQQLIFRASNRQALQQFLHALDQQLEQLPHKSKVKLILDIDPIEL